LRSSSSDGKWRRLTSASSLWYCDRDGNKQKSAQSAGHGHAGAGIFLRGDYACPMAFALDAALSAMADGKAPSPITIAQLRGLGRVLSSCNEGDGEPANVQQMRSFAACVETAE
jgi:hypothetical protein